MESWLPIFGYEGIYEVSDLGRVKTIQRISNKKQLVREKIRIGTKFPTGYLRIELNGSRKFLCIGLSLLHSMVILNYV